MKKQQTVVQTRSECADTMDTVSTDFANKYKELVCHQSKEKNEKDFIDFAGKGYVELVSILVEQCSVNVDAENGKALRVSAQNGHLPMVQYLVEHGAEIHKCGDEYSGFLKSVENGHLDIIKYFVKQGVKINIHKVCNEDEEKSYNAMYYAYKNGDLDVVKYLLKQGMSPIEYDGFRECVKNNHLNVMKFLIEQFEVEPNCFFESTVECKNIDALMYCLQKNKSLKITADILSSALYAGIEFVKALVEYGGIDNVKYYVNMKNCYGTLLEQCACMDKKFRDTKLDIVKFLVENGAIITNKVLYNTIRLESIGTFRYLISKGAVLPEDACTYAHDSIVMMRVLVAEFHVNVNAVSKTEFSYEFDMGKCALEMSASKNNLQVMRYLIENGADINLPFKNNNAFGVSASKGYLDIVMFLIEQGINLNEKCYSYGDSKTIMENAFFNACANGHLRVVEYLLSKGVDIHADSENALQTSADNGHLDIVKFLVENGADIHAKENSALKNCFIDDDATWHGNRLNHYEVAKYLLSKGANIDVLPLKQQRRLLHSYF